MKLKDLDLVNGQVERKRELRKAVDLLKKADEDSDVLRVSITFRGGVNINISADWVSTDYLGEMVDKSVEELVMQLSTCDDVLSDAGVELE